MLFFANVGSFDYWVILPLASQYLPTMSLLDSKTYKNKSLNKQLLTRFYSQAKQLELADRMDLASYLLKPVQRMGKYALLLQQLMKASRQDVKDIKEAESMVRFQLRHGNDLLAMDSLRECDVSRTKRKRLLSLWRIFLAALSKCQTILTWRGSVTALLSPCYCRWDVPSNP
jgi:RhoGEF, Guanine nucleotide exchange factor for Rho/Rac/Cdc42-like GTPases